MDTHCGSTDISFPPVACVVPSSPRRGQWPPVAQRGTGQTRYPAQIKKQRAVAPIQRAEPAVPISVRSAMQLKPQFLVASGDKHIKETTSSHEAQGDESGFAFSAALSEIVQFEGAAETESSQHPHATQDAEPSDAAASKKPMSREEMRHSMRQLRRLSLYKNSFRTTSHHSSVLDEQKGISKTPTMTRMRALADDPFVKRVRARENQRRRLKKDAHSLYSVLLPVFDEETETIEGGCVFPRGVHVKDAIQLVLEKERGEVRTRTSGIAIRDFLARSTESHEVVLLYFWYVVAHIRRARNETMLIGRYVNLERAFQTLLPRYRADLPPLARLEELMALTLRTMMQDNKGSFASRDVSTNSANGVLPADEKRLGTQRRSRTGDSIALVPPIMGSRGEKRPQSRNMAMDVDLNAWVRDFSTVLRFADAVDEFTVVHTEINELASFAQRCFYRLAIVFGRAFGRLKEEKDEVFSAFIVVVSHVVYFMLVYCFPNDDIADLFNAAFRSSLYRIFFFWCSGLFATYVRVNDWPSPLHLKESFSGEASMESTSTSKLPLKNPSPPRQREPRESYDSYEGIKRCPSGKIEDSLSLTSCTNAPTPHVADGLNETALLGETLTMSLEKTIGESFSTLRQAPKPLGDTGFDDVDVEVANGHHRLVIEFRRYAKHVSYLVEELKQRTTGPTDKVVGAANKSSAKVSPRRKRTRKSNVPLSNHQADQDVSLDSDGLLPPILPRSSLTKPASPAALSVSPLKHAPPRIRHYIFHQTQSVPAEVPLPPLEDEPQPGRRAAAGEGPSPLRRMGPGNTSFAARTRSQRVPLPTASPFFLYYARKELHLELGGAPNEALVAIGAEVSQNMGSMTSAARKSPALHRKSESDASCTKASTSRRTSSTVSGGENKSSCNLPSNVPAHAQASARPAYGKQPSREVKVMVIPPSDARVRPLQFKGFTQEVSRRQRAFEMKMQEMAVAEQQMRRQYDQDSQRSLRHIHSLLLAAETGRVRARTYKKHLSKSRKRNKNDQLKRTTSEEMMSMKE